MRYDVAVQTPIAFHTQRQYGLNFPPAEDVVIEFQGRRFVWHATHRDIDDRECWPTVTTMVLDGDDYAPERAAMQRFLSAVSFHWGEPLEIVNTGGAGWPGEMDRPIAISARGGDINHLYEAPLELVVDDDPRLARVMGYYREGETTASPFFKFLAFFGALDVACEDYPHPNDPGPMPAWVRANQQRHAYHWGGEQPPADLWVYLHEERRHAAAHAIRDRPDLPELDPNDPDERARFHTDSRLVATLVKDRVRERWGQHAVWERRRPLQEPADA